MSHQNGSNGTRTIGWDSIDSSVDECELVRVDLSQPPGQRDVLGQLGYNNTEDWLERLTDVGNIIARGKREVRFLQAITHNYGLDKRECDANVDTIVYQTLNTVHHVAKPRDLA